MEKRDLFNILYGTAPMFMFNRQVWEQYKDRFARSYKDICPVIRAVGYAEMTDHRFLTPGRDVQQTIFTCRDVTQRIVASRRDGVTITVNFGDKSYQLPGGKKIEPMSYHITGMQN
jgi:hypothetical protein